MLRNLFQYPLTEKSKNIWIIYLWLISCSSSNGNDSQQLEIKRTDRLPKRPIFLVYLKEALKNGSLCELEIPFSGHIWDIAEGLFKASYTNENGVKVWAPNKKDYIQNWQLLNTYFHFDFSVLTWPPKIGQTMHANFSHALTSLHSKCLIPSAYRDHQILQHFSIAKFYKRIISEIQIDWLKQQQRIHCFFCIFLSFNKTNYVIDHFKTTEPLSTFAFGFIISQLTRVNSTSTISSKPTINVWARKDFHGELSVSFPPVP